MQKVIRHSFFSASYVCMKILLHSVVIRRTSLNSIVGISVCLTVCLGFHAFLYCSLMVCSHLAEEVSFVAKRCRQKSCTGLDNLFFINIKCVTGGDDPLQRIMTLPFAVQTYDFCFNDLFVEYIHFGSNVICSKYSKLTKCVFERTDCILLMEYTFLVSDNHFHSIAMVVIRILITLNMQ